MPRIFTREGGAGFADASHYAVVESTAAYEAAIGSEAQRIAFNSLARQCIVRAEQRNREKVFTSKGVDALGSARHYMALRSYYGDNHPKTQEADRVFDADARTGLFEETEDLHYFSESYPIVDNSVMMADRSWDELAANGVLDERVDQWYLGRGFLEIRESLVAGEMLKTGEAETHDLITVSNRATANNAEEYGLDSACMIRFISIDSQKQTVSIGQLMMQGLPDYALQELFAGLGVEVDEQTIQDTPDSSTKYLATQIKVKKGELQNGAADIAYLTDYIMSERTGQPHLFGGPIEAIEANPYADIFELSKRKEIRRQQATQMLKQRFKELVIEQPRDIQNELRKAFEDARSMVADIEGVEFVRERYGEPAAEALLRKQAALREGSWNKTVHAEQDMQYAMGDVVVCGQRLSANTNICLRLPEPGEMSQCPGCHRSVRVAGTRSSIRCSRLSCKLVDPKIKKRAMKEKQQLARKQAKERQAKLERKKKTGLTKKEHQKQQIQRAAQTHRASTQKQLAFRPLQNMRSA